MRIYLDMVGCRLNQSEIEIYARQFRLAGHTLVASADQADLVVINTCAVTDAAAADSRQKIRQSARLGAGRIVVTGCWSTLDARSAAALPGVAWVIPNQEKDRLVSTLLQLPDQVFDQEFQARQLLPGTRQRTRAFIKVQDGCNNRCTFCVASIARGPGRSRPVAAVLREIQSALAGGAQEIVLTGVHLGSWGQDFDPPERLASLVEAILAQVGLPRLRLSSVEPWDLDAAFFSLWQDERLCRHLHLPLQSGCAATLQRMARKITPQAFLHLVSAARQAIPDVAITTDMIVGFPGETEAEFKESMAFVEQMDFAGGHVFTYSARPGTAAARMPAQTPHAERKVRSMLMRAEFERASAAYRSRFVGSTLPVLWESAVEGDTQPWQVSGLTDNNLRVAMCVAEEACRGLWNTITPARLTALTPRGLLGVMAEASDD